MRTAALHARQAANEHFATLRTQRQNIKTYLQTAQAYLEKIQLELETLIPADAISQHQYAQLEQDKALLLEMIALKQQHLQLLNEHIHYAVQELQQVIIWQMQLEFIENNQLINQRKQLLNSIKAVLKEQEHILEIEQQELTERVAGLATTENTVAGLTALVDEALLKKEAAEVAVKNLTLEQQSIETRLAREQEQIEHLTVELAELRQKSRQASELQTLQATRFSELTNQINAQKKLIELEKRALEVVHQRIAQAKKRLELALHWYDNVQLVLEDTQKTAFEAQLQRQQQQLLSQAAQLRWQLNQHTD